MKLYWIILLLLTLRTVQGSRFKYKTKVTLSNNPGARIKIAAVIDLKNILRKSDNDLWYAKLISLEVDPDDRLLSGCSGTSVYVSFQNEQLDNVYSEDIDPSCARVMTGAILLLKNALLEATVGGTENSFNTHDRCTVVSADKDSQKIQKSLLCQTELSDMALGEVVSLDCNTNISLALPRKPADITEHAQSTELCQITLKAYSGVGIKVINKQELHLQSVQETESTGICSGLATVSQCVEKLLQSEGLQEVDGLFDGSRTTGSKLYLTRTWELPEHLTEGRKDAALTFLRAIAVIESASKDDLKALLERQGRQSKYVLDVLAFCRTKTCFDTSLDYLKLHKAKPWQKQERYLNMLAQRDDAPEWMIKALMELLVRENIKSDKVHATLLLTIGALAKTSMQYDGTERLKQTVTEFFTSGIKNCKYREGAEDCELRWLQGMRNLGSAFSLPVLKDHLCGESSSEVQAETLRSLNSMSISCLTNAKVIKQLWMIFLNVCPSGGTEYPARILAAELLIKAQLSEKPLMQHESFLKLLTTKVVEQKPSNKEGKEFQALVMEKLRSAYSKNVKKRQILSSFVRQQGINELTLQRFDTMSMQGSGNLDGSSGVSVGFTVDMEFGSQLLQNSNFDLYYETGSGPPKSLLGFRLYTQGLDQYVSDGQLDNIMNQLDGAEESSESGAGIQLIFLGKSIRPYWFFQGIGELFSVVWNRATGEKIEGFQGNFLLANSTQHLILRNGFMIDADLQSAISFSLNGSIYISIWSRTLQSRISNNVGLATLFHMATHVGTETSINANASVAVDLEIDFDTDGDASEAPMRFCGRINQDQVNGTIQVSSFTQTGEEIKSYATTAQSFTVPPRTIGLSRSINEMCKEYFNSQDYY